MTIMDTDLELIQALDFEFAPPCESPATECDETAEWKLQVRCCGHVYLFCDKHIKGIQKSLASEDVRAQPLLCWKCHALTTFGEIILSMEKL